MKKISILMIAIFFALTSISAQTQQECTKKAMDAGAAEVKLCDGKKGDERKVKEISLSKKIAQRFLKKI
ncbi:MAG: hypothetical protein SFU98_18000 [Leptospiraceae bacterium]|nr:hypothetical protein [Leptospiraceae bacterium]